MADDGFFPTDDQLAQSAGAVNAALAAQGKTLSPTGISDVGNNGQLGVSDITRLFNPASGALDQAIATAQKAQKIRDKEADDMRKSAEERRRLATDIASVPSPPDLQLQDLPPEPEDKTQRPDNAFGSILGAFAALAGALGRRPAIDTMNALSGVMKGAYQGQKEQRDYQYQLWQANMQRVQAQNTKTYQEYESILKNTQFTVDQKTAHMAAVIAANQDTVAADEFQAKGLDGVATLQEKRADLMSKMGDAEAKATMQLFQFGNTDAWVDSVGNYDMPYPTSPFFLRSPAGQQFMTQLAAKYPDYSPMNYSFFQKQLNEYGQSGSTGKQINAIKTVFNHIDDVMLPLAKALDNHDQQALNRISNFAQSQFGMAIPTNFDAANIFVSDELVKALLNSNAGGVTDRSQAQTIFDRAKSEGQLTGAVTTVGGLLYQKLQTVKETYESQMAPKKNHRPFDELEGTSGYSQKLKAMGGGGVTTLDPKDKKAYDALPKGAQYQVTGDNTVYVKQ